MAAALSATRFVPPLALNLAALGESAAATATDYKALVCVFMIGGNDNFNTLVPYDAANYAIYTQQRPAIATAMSALNPTLLTPAMALAGGEQFALAPALAPLLPLFNGGQMAVMLNIGTHQPPRTPPRRRPACRHNCSRISISVRSIRPKDPSATRQAGAAGSRTCLPPATATPCSPASPPTATACS
jgi:hypothetical protein